MNLNGTACSTASGDVSAPTCSDSVFESLCNASSNATSSTTNENRDVCLLLRAAAAKLTTTWWKICCYCRVVGINVNISFSEALLCFPYVHKCSSSGGGRGFEEDRFVSEFICAVIGLSKLICMHYRDQ